MHACNYQSSLTYNYEKIVHEHHGLLSVWENRAGILHIDSNGEDQTCHVLLCGACPGNAQNNTLGANSYMRTTSAKAYYFSSKYQGL
jgi:hypothetical protein